METLIDSPESEWLPNPVWNALRTNHAGLALTQPLAAKYFRNVAPFAAIAEPTLEALSQLLHLMESGELTYIHGDTLPPLPPGMTSTSPLPCLQMVFPEDLSIPEALPVEPLGCDRSAQMLALTDIAFPGLFRIGTCRMGRYFGVRNEAGDLIAMGGERFLPGPWREISGLCTHPAYRGQGHAAQLLFTLLALHRAEDSNSWLHVVETNRNAINLYLRLGFVTVRRVVLHGLVKGNE